MITQEEVCILNERVDVVQFLESLGGYDIKQLRGKPDFRFPAFYRGGDNPHGCGITFNFKKRKWLVTDFTHGDFSNLDLIDFACKVGEMSFGQAVNLLISCSKQREGMVNVLSLASSYNVLEGALEAPRAISNDVLNCFERGLHPYLANRGFTPETVQRFGIGYCIVGELENRITIPIRNEIGELVAVQGRTYTDEIPKYKFLEGTGDSAKLCLYGLDLAYESIKERGWVVVSEGATSVWRLHQYGFNNAIATLSTSITDAQIETLLSLNCNIVLALDCDENSAGQIATIKLLKRLKEKNAVNVFTINSEKDINKYGSPDDFTFDEINILFQKARKIL